MPHKSISPNLEYVLHPTDFTRESTTAFEHALALALKAGKQLTLLHAGEAEKGSHDWRQFPSVRGTLERWGLIGPGESHEAVFERFAIDIKKVFTHGDDPVSGISHYAEHHAVDLIVLATGGREGLPRWLHRSVAEAVARRTHVPALFVPALCRGFVEPSSGHLRLRRILLPVDFQPDPDPAARFAAHLAHFTGNEAEIRALHAGTPNRPPELPEAIGARLEIVDGDPVEVIAKTAEDWPADLVVMATEGRHGLLDALRGSVTERVLHEVDCPLLAVPSGPGAS